MSTIKIRLPDPTRSGTPEEFLKQLELCVHHARKSVAVLREDQKGSPEDDICKYSLDSVSDEIEKLKVNDLPFSKDMVDESFWELYQEVDLEISIN